MSASVLVGFASRYGSTQEVAETVAATLRQSGLSVDIQPLREVRTISDYGAVVLGAPLFMFRWHKDARHFLSRHRKALTERPVVVFALGPTHDPYDADEWQDSWSQFKKELAKFPWFMPVALELFGGMYDPDKLGFLINKLAGDLPASDLRDWVAIRDWVNNLTEIFEPTLRDSSFSECS